MNRLESAATLRRLADELEARPHLPSRPVELMAEGLVAIAVGVLEQLGRAAPLRVCEWCGKPLVRKQFASRLESAVQYAKRRFCSQRCNGAARAAKNARARAWAESSYGRAVHEARRPKAGADAGEQALPGGALGRAVREAGAARRREAQAEPRRERPPSRPTPSPRPQPTPVREPAPARPDPKPAPVTAEAPRVRLPDPRPASRPGVGRPVALGEACPEHPSYTVGVYGCPACNAGRRWAESQRQVVARPRMTVVGTRIE